jgi:hypothetical protein
MTAADVERERTQGYQRRAPIETRRKQPKPRRGGRPPAQTKLTQSQVVAIRAAPEERGVIRRLAQQYEVTPTWVSKIRRTRGNGQQAAGLSVRG